MADGPEFMMARCKECNKEFEAKMSYFLRKSSKGELRVGRHQQYCSKACYRSYYRKVQQ